MLLCIEVCSSRVLSIGELSLFGAAVNHTTLLMLVGLVIASATAEQELLDSIHGSDKMLL